jgi:hypothetical protein
MLQFILDVLTVAEFPIKVLRSVWMWLWMATWNAYCRATIKPGGSTDADDEEQISPSLAGF